ncbi:LuxR C-terminal-related transcriptional regulator [Umezawaea sp. NPDC059074]|uniref:helix-turn-helix transcriptional regulator n=1 Tax=Umezawaea sp. NPDC059074 TaxID=3346716 RepID=UPI0036CB1063
MTAVVDRATGTALPVVVSVCSPDPLALPGVTRLLRGVRAVAVVPPARLAEAKVALVVSEELDHGVTDLIARIARSSTVRVVLAVDRVGDDQIEFLARSRVVALLPRHRLDADEIVDVVLEVVDRPVPSAAELPDRLRSTARTRFAGKDQATLSARECALLRLLADGHDTEDIARELAYSDRTVKKIIHQLLSRRGLRNRAQAVAYALREGYL